MYELCVTQQFAAAHRLPDYDGACCHIHGHTWHVKAVWNVERHPDEKTGMLQDFGELKERLRSVLPDHSYLNDVYGFVPTAENLARHFCEELNASRVTVWESDDAGCTYIADS